jgi:hypothetical protein
LIDDLAKERKLLKQEAERMKDVKIETEKEIK